MNQVGVDNAYASSFNKYGGQEREQLFPFLTGEVTNPQGFGDDTVSKMKTEGGQIASGATGQATEGAMLHAARTGNTAAVPAIIGAAARDTAKQQSNNALGVDIANAQEKLKQQQAGATGLGGLYSEDTNAVLKSLGLTNDAISAWTGARAKTFPAEFSNAFAGDLSKLITSIPGAALGG